MESFRVQENVPVEHHNIARTTNRLAVSLGHGAILAYANIYDSIWKTEYTEELEAQFAS